MPKQTARSRALVAYQPTAGNQRGGQQQKKRQGRSAQAAPRKSGNAMVPRSREGMATMYLKCLADPFNQPPCRLPDLYPGATVAFALTQDYTIASDAFGRVSVALTPGLPRALYTNVMDSAGVVTGFSYAAHDDYAATLGAYTWLRMVCGGMIVQYIGAAQTAAGWVSLVQDSDIGYTSTIGASIPGKSEDGFSGPASEGASATWTPQQEPRLIATSSIVGESSTFPCFHLIGEGLPLSTNVFRIRTIRHMEGPPTKINLARRSAMSGHASTAELEAAATMSPLLNPTNAMDTARAAVTTAATAVGVKALEYGASKALAYAQTTFPELLMLGM